MIFLLTFSPLLLVLIYFLQKSRKTVKAKVPPGPRRLPFIGNLHQLSTVGSLHLYLWQLSKIYGPIIQLKIGCRNLIVVSTAELAKQVLKTQDSAFCSRPQSALANKATYNNTDIVFSPYNEYWREMKKITSIHLFSLKKVQSFRPIREDEVCRLITKISRSASSHQSVDLSEMAMALGSSLICRIAFGKRYDDEGWDRRRFSELLHETQAAGISFSASDYFQGLGWVDKLTGLREKVDTLFHKLDSFYQELIDDHLHPSRLRTEAVADILDILIQLKEDPDSSSITLTWDNIKALLMNIFVAGTDTTAGSIIWTMSALIKAPNAMKKVQAEIRNLISDKGKVDEDDLPELPYLKAVITEAFRLYPTAPLLIPRETMERCMLEGYEIQPKTIVYVNAWAVGRDPDYWENPNEFLPERFLNNPINLRGQDFGLIPFGSGRRMCPGISMGLATVELALANLLYSFDWELPPGIRHEDVDMDPTPGFAVQKKNALILVPKKGGFKEI